MGNGPFPDDDLRRALRRLVRLGSLLEPHSHHHAGSHLSLSEMMALGERPESNRCRSRSWGSYSGWRRAPSAGWWLGCNAGGGSDGSGILPNRRFYQLQLTPQGRTVADRIGQDLRAHHEQLLGALTPDEREALTVGLTGLARALASNPLHPSPQVSEPAEGNA